MALANSNRSAQMALHEWQQARANASQQVHTNGNAQTASSAHKCKPTGARKSMEYSLLAPACKSLSVMNAGTCIDRHAAVA